MSLPHYTIVREIGSGAMGKVMLATNDHGERVALKMLFPQFAGDQLYRSYFERECRTLSRMAHPSVVGVVGKPFSDSAGNLFLPMQYVDGVNINQLVSQYGAMDDYRAARYMYRILEAFEYIHSNGLVHRDVKPSNIMVTGEDSVCIIDFGIVRDNRAGGVTMIAGRPAVVGTNGYMSPEQLSGLHIDHRSDIYSLGCLLHFMLTGHHAVNDSGDEQSTRLQISRGNFPSAQAINPAISSEMQRIIYKAVDKNMLNRFQNAAEFKQAMLQFGPISLGPVAPDIFDIPLGGHYVITVGRHECDIYVGDANASRHHLDLVITCEARDDGSLKRRVTIVDNSTNGTVINGYTYHNTAVKYDFDRRRYLDIRPAGGNPIDWNRIEVILSDRINRSAQPPYDPVMPPAVPQPMPADTFHFGWALLSFLFPIVGIIMYFVRRKRQPSRALSSYLIPAAVSITIGIISALAG